LGVIQSTLQLNEINDQRVSKIDQSHRTSTSDLEEGSWNESFELKVSYHNQLFDTVQLDLFDNNLFFPDKHIGRAEIRLKNLEGMPETFDSYYEVVDKKMSMGATSQVSRKTIMTSGVGAIQAQIGYRYRYQKESRSMSVDLTEMNMLIDQQKQALTSHVDQSDADEREMATEFQNHLETQRARDSEDIEFRKFEEGQEEFPDDSTNDDIDDDDEMLKQNTNAATNKPYKSPLTLSVSRASTMSEATFDQVQDTNENNNTILGTVGSFFGYNNNKKPVVAKSVKTKESLEKINTQFIPQEEDTLKSFPILDTIGSWTMAKETNQVLRAIGKILVAYVSILLLPIYNILLIYVYIIGPRT
jgi:hypothetical protein